ncbi:MAG: ABC transporter ATP-binding protein [Acidimicrobiia bacterium]
MITDVATKERLRVSNVSKNYGGVRALDSVDLGLNSHEVLGLFGQNGAGKSTLVDIICGATPATSGEVLVDGQALSGSSSRRARLGLARTFQYPQVAGELTVEQNLLLGYWGRRAGGLLGIVRGTINGVLRSEREEGVERARELAASCGIEDLQREASELSLGEQRLVEVIRALLLEPSVLLLDEPFAGADADAIRAVEAAISTSRDAGCAVLLVDHNVDLVALASDRMALLHDGRVVVEGLPEECLASADVRRVYLGKE